MSTGSCMEMLHHGIVHLKLKLHCMLTTWKLNKNFKNKKKIESNLSFFTRLQMGQMDADDQGAAA